jgi:hypothetical protein
LTTLEEVTCVSPAYVARHGLPEQVDALQDHYMVGFHSSATGAVLPLEFTVGTEMSRVMLPLLLTVSGAGVYAAAARAGLGLIQGAAVPAGGRSPPRIAADGAGQHTAVAPSHFRAVPTRAAPFPATARLRGLGHHDVYRQSTAFMKRKAEAPSGSSALARWLLGEDPFLHEWPWPSNVRLPDPG